MPISGLTNVPHQFLKLGQIRKGEKQIVTVKRDDGSTYQVEKPVDLDYFRVTFVGDPKSSLVKKLQDAFVGTYGEKPREIRVRFAFPNIEDVWDANYEAYRQGGLFAKAGSTPERGMYWIFLRDFDNGDVIIRNEEPTCQAGFDAPPPNSKEPIGYYTSTKSEKVGVMLESTGRLQVVVPEITSVAVGYLEFRPESPRDIRNISAELGGYCQMAAGIDKDITGLPFILRRREEEISKHIKDKLSRGKSWVVHLDLDGEWASRAIAMQQRLALPTPLGPEVLDGDILDEAFLPAGPATPEPPTNPNWAATAAREAALNPQSDPEGLATEAAAELGGVADELIDPMGAAWVEWASLQWNISKSDAAKAIAGKNLGKSIPMSQFKKMVLVG